MSTPEQVPSRREREREEMRRLIIDAAQRLFVTEGYESTTIRRIAEAVEYTPGAIYSYFKDKDAILYAIHQAGFGELQQRFVAAIGAAHTPVEQLAQLGEAYISFARANPELYHLMFVAQATSRTLHEAASWPEGKAVYDSLRALVQVAVQDGWIRSGDPEVIAFLLWSAVHGAVTLQICDRCMVLPESHRDASVMPAYQYLLDTLVLPRSAGPPASAASPAPSSVAPEPRRRRSLPEQ